MISFSYRFGGDIVLLLYEPANNEENKTMKKLFLSAIMIVAFTAPSFAQINIKTTSEPYPGLEGLDCAALVEKMDLTLQEINITDELKAQILELRELGIEEKSKDNEDACVTSLTAAFQLLVPKE